MSNRDARGRFQPGHKVISPGRPAKPLEAEYQRVISETITPNVLREVLAKLIALAKQGNLYAIRTLLEYTVGKPAETAVLARVAALEALLSEFEEQQRIELPAPTYPQWEVKKGA